MYTVGPGIWQETLKNVENEKSTTQDLKYAKKHCKMWKMGELEYDKKTEKRGKV